MSESAIKRNYDYNIYGENSYLFSSNVSDVSKISIKVYSHNNSSKAQAWIYRTENLPYHITVKHRIDLNVGCVLRF